MTLKLSGSYSRPSFFVISAKKWQRTACSSWRGISSNVFASLRYTFHSENIQPSFCTLGGVLVFVFASPVGKLFFWKCRKSLICGDIAEKGPTNGKTWQISVAKLRHCKLLKTETTALKLCYASFYYRLYSLRFYWLRQTALYFLNWTVCLFLKENPIWNYPS